MQLVVPGGIQNGVDAAKALALGADAVSIGTAAMIALGCNRDVYPEDYARLGTKAGFCHHCHTGGCPVGITTQDPELMQRLHGRTGGRPRRELPAVDGDGDPDARAGVREVRRARPGARGPAFAGRWRPR